MAEFHFRLATLLRLRETVRDECRVQLAESQRADAALEQRLLHVHERQEHLRADCRTAAGPGVVDLGRLREARSYAAALRTEEDSLRQQRAALAIEIQERRDALIEADRDVRMLEKLRENRREQHQQEENRKEARRLDEAALQAVRT
jgi:flagellar protein FliJ